MELKDDIIRGRGAVRRIAELLGVPEYAVYKLRLKKNNPLPAGMIGNNIVASRQAILDWMSRSVGREPGFYE